MLLQTPYQMGFSARIVSECSTVAHKYKPTTIDKELLMSDTVRLHLLEEEEEEVSHLTRVQQLLYLLCLNTPDTSINTVLPFNTVSLSHLTTFNWLLTKLHF